MTYLQVRLPAFNDLQNVVWTNKYVRRKFDRIGMIKDETHLTNTKRILAISGTRIHHYTCILQSIMAFIFQYYHISVKNILTYRKLFYTECFIFVIY